MIKSKLFNLYLFLFLLVIAGQVNAQSISVDGSIANGIVKRGSVTQGSVVINIPSGLHVNSNLPRNEYSIPTTVRINNSEIKLSSIRYPRGKNRKFGFSEKTINVYEGRAVFTFTFTVPANFKGSDVKIRAVVRYQACTDEFCYPPKTQEITLTARVEESNFVIEQHFN
jgi:DsbC/DsbD-like thiol-disulfide interchange protein